MPSLLIHLALGAIVVAVAFKPRITILAVIIFLFAAILTDLDSIAVHRATLHNIFLPIGLTAAYVFFQKKDLLDTYYLQVFAMCIALISLHIIFDLFSSSIFLFYPFTGEGIHFGFWFGATDTGLSFILDPIIEGSTEAISGTVTTLVYVVTPSPGLNIPIIESGYDFGIMALGGALLSWRMWRERHGGSFTLFGESGGKDTVSGGAGDDRERQKNR